jgi:hypothetical protein
VRGEKRRQEKYGFRASPALPNLAGASGPGVAGAMSGLSFGVTWSKRTSHPASSNVAGWDAGLGLEMSYTSFASSVISVLLAKSFEIGQPALAFVAALSNASLVALGTLAVVVSAIFVTEKPSPTFARVTAA